MQSRYFFCGIGGSGMLPLAMILYARGFEVGGSDRSYDQGRTPEKFTAIERHGLTLFPQDGSGIAEGTILVVSSAIENTIPDIRAAQEKNIPIVKRAELLAEVFNKAKTRVAIAGTSGKSTTTGMLGFILDQMNENPTVMNGAVFKDFVSAENPFATAITGDEMIFVTEADESDGSITFYKPTISVLNNIALDHKSMDELQVLFAEFLDKAETAIVNLDNDPVAVLAKSTQSKIISYSLHNADADFYLSDITARADGISAKLNSKFLPYTIDLKLSVPGRHNLSNALAALSVIHAMGFAIEKAARILAKFTGVKRRMDVIGSKRDITVIDDFAHNPDKIAATLQTLKEFDGRLLIVFQMHGFAPMKLMKNELQESFAKYLGPDDMLFMPEILYLGGTVDRNASAKDFLTGLASQGINTQWYEKRAEILSVLLREAKPGDRIVIMGARDDTLTDFAREVLAGL